MVMQHGPCGDMFRRVKRGNVLDVARRKNAHQHAVCLIQLNRSMFKDKKKIHRYIGKSWKLVKRVQLFVIFIILLIRKIFH
ncbi:hypothetical protein BrL25_13225 [Brevibacillus laterosporus DSM 25]|nr:hypothetical protein BrL25_13225 [Brevibacillus laterosporus DSM 25]